MKRKIYMYSIESDCEIKKKYKESKIIKDNDHLYKVSKIEETSELLIMMILKIKDIATEEFVNEEFENLSSEQAEQLEKSLKEAKIHFFVLDKKNRSIFCTTPSSSTLVDKIIEFYSAFTTLNNDTHLVPYENVNAIKDFSEIKKTKIAFQVKNRRNRITTLVDNIESVLNQQIDLLKKENIYISNMEIDYAPPKEIEKIVNLANSTGDNVKVFGMSEGVEVMYNGNPIVGSKEFSTNKKTHEEIFLDFQSFINNEM